MAEKAVGRIRVTVMLGNSLTDRDTLAVLELLQPESPAEILGLFIEDSELLSLADIPVVREYCLLTQVERRLQAGELERQFRAQARIAEQALARAASPRGYPWSFRSLRGDPVVLLREMLAEVDLMLLGAAAGMTPATRRRGGGAAGRPGRSCGCAATRWSRRPVSLRALRLPAGRPPACAAGSADQRYRGW